MAETSCQNDHDRLVRLETAFHEYRVSMEARLDKLNELREQVMNDRQVYLRQDVYGIARGEMAKKIEALETRTSWQSVLLGIGSILVPVAGAVGLWLGHMWR